MLTPDEHVANRIANDLVARANAMPDRTKPIGVPVVLALEARAKALGDAVRARWKTMLSAYSSGIAHADPDVDTTPQLATLAQLQKVEFVVTTDRAKLPASVLVVYATFPLDDAWRSALSGATIVELGA